MKLAQSITAFLILTICGFQVEAQFSEDVETVLKKSADAVYKSDTLYCERDYSLPEVRGKIFQCKERYYLQNNSDGTFNALFQSTIFTGSAKMPTFDSVYLKNAEGLWEVYPTLAINVSGIAKDPPSIDPFQHLRTLTPEHYKLELSETNESNQKFYVITGKSLQPDLDRKISVTNSFIPIEFKAVIDKLTFLPHEIDEVEQNDKRIDKKFNTIELHRQFDAGLFDLGNRKKSTPSTLREYAQLKLEGLGQQFNIKGDLKLPQEIKNLAGKKALIRLVSIVVLAIVPITLIIFAVRKKQLK